VAASLGALPPVSTRNRQLAPIGQASIARLRLLDAGYPPVPAKGKLPGVKAWTRYATAFPSPRTIAGWDTRLPTHQNTGVVCGAVRVLDLDVDDPGLSARCQAAISAILGTDSPCRIGRWPRAAIFFRAHDPDRCTERHRFSLGSVEFLGKGAQVIVDGTHPDTGSPYYWVNEPLWEVWADRLPILNEEMESTLVSAMGAILYRKKNAGRPTGSRPKSVSTGLTGFRNDDLFLRVVNAAFVCDTKTDLLARASDLNQSTYAFPLPDSEVRKMVNGVWKRKEARTLFRPGGEAHAMLPLSLLQRLPPDAIKLLGMLKCAHGARPNKLFALVPKAMSKSLGICAHRIARARQFLLDHGYLEQVGPRGGKGRPTQYRFRR